MMIMTNGSAEVCFDKRGTYHLTLPGFRLRECRSMLLVDDAPPVGLDWNILESSSELLVLGCINRYGTFQLEFHPAVNRSALRGIELRLNAHLNVPRRKLQLIPIACDRLPAEHLLSQGGAMGKCHSVCFPVSGRKGEAQTGHYLLMLRRGGMHLQLSTPLRRKYPFSFHWRLAPEGLEQFLAAVQLQHNDVREIKCDPVKLFSSEQPFRMMEDWSEENVEVSRKFPGVIPAGWNSWDYYRWTITEEEVLKNAEFIRRDPILSRHVKRIIVDDGWQYCYGEWEANPLFPSGMAQLARELTQMGFEPGLWFAPTVVEPHARIAQLDYNMLAMSEGGQPCTCYSCMGRSGFVLDPTLPAVQRYLAALFDRYAGMGYRYFKLDFLSSTLNAAQFHDRSVPRSEIVRMVMKPISEAVNGRAALLGCNYSLEAGNRYVDAVRIGADIHATWEAIRGNALPVAARFWSHRKHWINDPDFTLARSSETSSDAALACHKPGQVFIKAADSFLKWADSGIVDVGKAQIEILLSIVLMSGGAINFSDDLTKLNGIGLELLRRTVEAKPGERGIALDLFESEIPAHWRQMTENGWRLLWINWNDTPTAVEFQPESYGIKATSVRDFWSDEPMEFGPDGIRLELLPRSCRLIEFQ
ncbi:MAG: alpha-galactosidase [Lentisphaeria bacterium]|nr:alpha-galactosidase [Lentisphaeria bacterium]